MENWHVYFLSEDQMQNCLEKQANKGMCCEPISLTSQRGTKKKKQQPKTKKQLYMDYRIYH